LNPDWLTYQFCIKSALLNWVAPFDLTVWMITVWLVAVGQSPICLALDTNHYSGIPGADSVPSPDGYLAIVPATVGQYQLAKQMKAGQSIYCLGVGLSYGFTLHIERITTDVPIVSG